MKKEHLQQLKERAASAGMLFLDAARDAINAGNEKLGKAFIKLARANTQAFKKVAVCR